MVGPSSSHSRSLACLVARSLAPSTAGRVEFLALQLLLSHTHLGHGTDYAL